MSENYLCTFCENGDHENVYDILSVCKCSCACHTSGILSNLGFIDFPTAGDRSDAMTRLTESFR